MTILTILKLKKYTEFYQTILKHSCRSPWLNNLPARIGHAENLGGFKVILAFHFVGILILKEHEAYISFNQCFESSPARSHWMKAKLAPPLDVMKTDSSTDWLIDKNYVL